MKQIAVLGSTGSIGTQTLEVVRANEDMQIVTLAAGSNIDLLEKQIVEFTPKLVCVYLEDKAKELQERLHLRKDAAADTEIVTGMDGLIACATYSDSCCSSSRHDRDSSCDRGDQVRERHCLCQQRNIGDGRSHHYAFGGEAWR